MIPYKQLSLNDIFQDCQNKFENDKPAFLSLLEQHICLDEIVPATFYNHFYASTGRTRKYPLKFFLWALIIQRIFSIPTDQLLIVFQQYSSHLREFCRFDKVPDASYDPYKTAYGSMPSHAAANAEIKQLYINGYFCYAPILNATRILPRTHNV